MIVHQLDDIDVTLDRFPDRLCLSGAPSRDICADMGINSPSEEAADLQIGPTDQGMVRIFVFSEKFEIPLDFAPEDAEEIAEELMAAAKAAREIK